MVWFIALSFAVNMARNSLDQTLLLTTRAIEAEVDRFSALPNIAAQDARIRAALSSTGSREDANRYLEAIARQAGADQLYLIDGDGDTIAASNWDQPGSFIGQNYAFRPYFQDAMATGHGRFYAIGVTTGVPGYFLSARVNVGDTVGVMVVKLDLQPLQETWRAAGADVGLVDENGIIFLAARPEWQYRPLIALQDDVIANLTATRAYNGVALDEATGLLSSPPDGLNVTGTGWIGRLAPVTSTGWRVVAARPTAPLNLMAVGWAVLATLATLAVAAGFKTWEQRRQLVALRLSQSVKLETMVIARTADLAHEIDARAQVEADLRATQQILIHTEKMAALGRMSAAIVHEISQPLAAMEATLSAAELGLKQRDDALLTRLGKVRGLIRRMQRTTKHLKSFARKETGELALVDVRQTVTSALELVEPRSRVVGITPEHQMPEGPVHVLAGAVRIEQVIVNLLLNALDAVQDCADATITLTLLAEDGLARLTVSDTGSGIAKVDLERVTEPFFSTKLTGEGLGLGLSICKAIIDDFGGELKISSLDGKGAQVEVSLPLADLPERIAT